MKKNKNIDDFIQNVTPEPLKFEDKEFYVDFYNQEIKKLQTIILLRQGYDSLYIAGQIGTGKSTAMQFFVNEEIKNKFHVVYINYRDLIDPDDTETVDIFLMFCFQLIKDSKKLQKIFFDKLEFFKRVYDEKIQAYKEIEKGNNISVGIEKTEINLSFLKILEAKMGFLNTFKFNRNTRNVTREIFRIDENAVIELSNEIINKFYEEFGTDKKLLVIFDDLEKIRKIDDIEKIFISNNNKFSQIKCKKIITIPIHLTTKPLFRGDSYNIPTIFNIKLFKNPLSHKLLKEQEEIILKNKQLFFELIEKRCENIYNIIEKDAINLATEKSGGILREYIRILGEAAILVKMANNNKISKKFVENAIDTIRAYQSLQIVGKNKNELLFEILNKHQTANVNENEVIEAILANQIIVYKNNDFWYGINPIIEETVKNYNQSSNTEIIKP